MQVSNLLKQRNIKGIGSFIHVLYLTTPLFGLGAYVMSAITMYTVLLPYIKPVMPWLTIQAFFGIAFLLFVLVLASFYKFVYPSYMAFQNKQTYIHKNPMQEDLEKIKKRLGIEKS